MLVGTTSLSKGGQSYNVDLIISHPEYSSGFPIQNDVAVIRLTSEIEFSSEINKITLAQNVPPERVFATLTGWGFTSLNPSLEAPDKLQTIDLRIISNEYCSSKLGMKIPDSSLCTLNGYDEGACNGDR